MKALKSLDLKSASPDSRLCSAVYLFLSSGAVMTACHLAVTLQLHSPAFAELQSCNGIHANYPVTVQPVWREHCVQSPPPPTPGRDSPDET